MSKRRQASLEPPEGLRITKLELHAAGFYMANVSLNGDTVTVTNKQGAWYTVPKRGQPIKCVMPRVAAALQAKIATDQNRRTNGTDR